MSKQKIMCNLEVKIETPCGLWATLEPYLSIDYEVFHVKIKRVRPTNPLILIIRIQKY